jgi:hypothetical protein
MELSFSCEATNCAATQELSSIYRTRRFITMFTRAFHGSPFFYICFNYSLLGNRSKQWLFLYKVFPVRFLAADFNTGTVTVSLPISLHYSTYKAFKSHVKSSLADFLKSSLLLIPIRFNPAAHSSRYIAAARTA